MKRGLLIKDGLLVAGSRSYKADVLVVDGVIAQIAPSIAPAEGCEEYDAEGCVVSYGLADVHVHFREPGYSAKETIRSGSLAAAHGGYTTVCTMPNLNPAPDALDTLAVEQELIAQQACIDVRPYATITRGRKGKSVVDVAALASQVAGFSDDGNGVQQGALMREAMQCVAEADSIVAAHCEDNSLLRNGYIHDGAYAAAHGHRGICSASEYEPIARDVAMAVECGCRYHVCHISTAESVDIIREAKRTSNLITCETAPHYLTLCDDDLQEDGRFKMNPPLRSRADRDALLQGIVDGTIEVIATDHAPHTAEEKSKGLVGSAMGIVGLETAFAVCYTHLVRKGVIGIEQLIALLCDNPRRIFRLGGALAVGEEANIAVFDITHPYSIRSEEFLSQGKATPFEGWEVYGRCMLTLYKGAVVWKA